MILFFFFFLLLFGTNCLPLAMTETTTLWVSSSNSVFTLIILKSPDRMNSKVGTIALIILQHLQK